MAGVQERDGLPEIPKPCDYFDLICGSGTGGLIAILLGRLHMTVDKCIDILSNFPGAPENLFPFGRAQYNSNELRNFILQVIEETKEDWGWVEIPGEGRELPQEEKIEEDLAEEDPSCKTMVLTMNRKSMLLPKRLRTYRTRMGDKPISGCKIWQAALASVADIDTSEAVALGDPPMLHCSATFAYANASKEALDEATRIWQADAIQLFVNIGAGKSGLPRRLLEHFGKLVSPYFRLKSSLQLFAQLATDTEAVAEMVERDARVLDFTYMRFSVPNLLDAVDAEEWKKGPADVKDLTAQYLDEKKTKNDIRFCAGSLAKTSPGFELTASSDAVWVRPLDIHRMVPNIFHSQLRNTRSSLYDTHQRDDNHSDFESSDEWFQILFTKTHAFASSGLKQNEHTAKIAILDTGFDSQHPKLEGNAQIADHKSFLAGFPKADEDVCGHGTHATALLMKVAPNAKLYVARVAENYDSGIAVESVVQAINWAVENKVDIITMSFGYPNVNEDIQAAINRACEKNVIIFAAASNGGANNVIDIAFPARMIGLVICVSSTDGMGNPSKYNPPAGNDRYNFSTLGEAVLSAWPINLDPEGEKRCSGTSIATPIAAAIAALIIGFVKQRGVGLNAAHKGHVKSIQGMQQLFLALGTMKNGYCYIAPWKLLRPTTYPGDVVSRIRLAVEKYYGSDSEHM